MAYAPVSSAVATPERGPFLDHSHGRLFNFALSDGAQTGGRYFDTYPNGNEIRVRTIADIGIPAIRGPWTFCYAGQLLAMVQDASNGARLLYMNPNDFTLLGSFGAADSSFDNSATHIEQPTSICAFQDGRGGDYVICNSAFSDGVLNAVGVMRLNTYLGTVDENSTVLGALPDGSALWAYAIGYTKLGGATQIGLYRLEPGIVRVAKILPTAIDASWSHIDNVYGITIDQTDGNLIAGVVNNTDTPTHPAYLVKLNAGTGAVMWACATGDAGINYNTDDMRQNLVTRGTLLYLAGATNTLLTINTVTGAKVVSILSNFTVGPLHAAQVSEDITGSIYWFGSWSEGSSHPAYLGTYCLVEGHQSGDSLVWRYFPAGAPDPAPSFAIAAQSRRRAWSFAFDGHVFYVLDLGVEGTFAYDDTTQQWSKFITQTWNGWNLTNGTVWGRRIVGGDFLTGDVWEMQPGALLDNGTIPIVHVVTGGLVKRNRVFSSVESLRLNVSVGQLDLANGATVQLSFSDDQGQSFTDMDTLTMAQGDIVWRSLGAFAAPGRIFRVTDVGAFLRIDGADAAIDNFDEDSVQSAQGS